MKNPLNKRLPREFKSEFGKYLVILILLVAIISLISGFLIADGSMKRSYDESFEKYHVEDGNFDLSKEMMNYQKEKIEQNNVTIFENYFVEKSLSNDTTLRVFKNRDKVNQVCLMAGKFPKKTGQIAIDRMYADNNHIEIGDTIQSGNKDWKVTGLAALSDYSALFSNNNDTMFDAVKFGVAVVTPEEFDSFDTKDLTYRYSWLYDTKPANETEENQSAEKLMKAIGKIVTLENYVPQYQNQAIHFTGNDMGSDRAMMIVLLYIVMIILAFVFGITISNTISKEANTIGTLRASGYTRGELIRHYLILPLAVTLAGAVIGNVLGYTILEKICADMYYGSYSLTKYKSHINAEAFILTTIVPFLVMLVINFAVLHYKLKISPLQFLRRDLKSRKQKKAMRLSNRISFFVRFRLRIIFQNRSNYLMLLIGILFANLLLLFGMGLPIVLNHYQDNVKKNMLSSYQTMLHVPISLLSTDNHIVTLDNLMELLEYTYGVKTDNETAEEFSTSSLNTTSDICDSEEILLYGIKNNSKYVTIDFSKVEADGDGNGVFVSSAYADKYKLKIGDTITLKEKYKSDRYNFKVKGVYDYIGALAIFMPQEQLNKTLDLEKDYFSGYFSKTKITDINSKYIGTVIDLESLTKVSRQLDVSMGKMMYLVDGFAILIFIVLIYLLSKLVIEKNTQSISMTKIMGYSNNEISRLYILATSVIVVLSLMITTVIDYYLMIWIFRQMMLSSMSGWICFEVDHSLFIKMFVTGILTHIIVAALEFRKVQKVPMEEALKNVE